MSNDRPPQDPRDSLAELWPQRQTLSPHDRTEGSNGTKQQAAEESAVPAAPVIPPAESPPPLPGLAAPATPSQAILDRRLEEIAVRERRLARLEQQLSQLRDTAVVRPLAPPPARQEPLPPLGEMDAQRSPLPEEAVPSELVAPNTPSPVTSPEPQDRRVPRLFWMALPLAVVVVAVLVAGVLATRGVRRASGPGLASAATPTVTPIASTTASMTPVATLTTGLVPVAGSDAPTATALAATASTGTPNATGTPSAASSATTASVSAVGESRTTTGDATAPLTLVSTMTIGQSLCDLAVDDSGQQLYVTDNGPQQLLVLNLATKQQVGQFNLGASSCSIAVDPQARAAYVPTWRQSGPTTYDSSQVQTIDLTTGVIRTAADNLFPTGPFFDQQKRVLYVGNTATPSLFTIDAATGTTHIVTLPVKVNRVAVSSKNGDLYLASPDGNKVLVVDPTTGSVVATLSAGQRPWAVVADPMSGRILVSSELSGSVSLIDSNTNQIIQTTPTGSHPRNLAVDGIHGLFYVLNTTTRTVSVLDANGRPPITSAPLPGAEDLSGIAVAGHTGQVFVVSKTHIYTLK